MGSLRIIASPVWLKGLYSSCRAGNRRTRVGNGPRCLMTLTIVAVVFGVFAIGLILLLIYKGTLTMHRDDQLFLDDASSHMHEEQTELLAKVNRLTIPVRAFGAGSGVFLLVFVGMLIYQKLNGVECHRKPKGLASPASEWEHLVQ